ncbi:MAG TPA: ABC transporter permease subunit [Anaerolineaceae bacterium]|nr:ABC transporter permease subunit [Anaerolineaceae bacterium]HPN50850.1 ABC transporter permease subunit [Anaerolineaceae bacterium]
MKNIWYIAKKEYASLFNSPVAYVILLVTFLTLGFFFWIEINYAVQYQQYVPSMSNTFSLLVFPLLFFAVPAITMRSIADENKSGTLELLLTSPVRDWELIIGKWLGCLFFFLFTLMVTLIYPLVLNTMIDKGIDFGLVFSGYLGVILLISAMCGIGVFISSLFNNQIAALFATLGVLILFWIISAPAQLFQGSVTADVLTYLSLTEHYYDTFLTGIIQLKDIIYYLSFTALTLLMANISIDIRRWR